MTPLPLPLPIVTAAAAVGQPQRGSAQVPSSFCCLWGVSRSRSNLCAIPGPVRPQGFAEKLFRRLQGGHERFETRLAMLSVVSRAVGVHKLRLLNFYPFLQASPALHSGRVCGELHNSKGSWLCSAK